MLHYIRFLGTQCSDSVDIIIIIVSCLKLTGKRYVMRACWTWMRKDYLKSNRKIWDTPETGNSSRCSYKVSWLFFL